MGTDEAAEWRRRVLEAEKRGDYIEAYDLADQALTIFPDDVWLRHRAVLIQARSGATERARRLYGDLGLARWETQSEDIAALAARLAKDQALLASGESARSWWRDAARRYEATFHRTGGYYPAVNAATTRLMAGDREDATAWAERTLSLCAAPPAKDATEGYYRAATRAEAHVLLGEVEQAERFLREAIAAHGGDFAAVAGTRRQLARVCEALEIDAAFLKILEPPGVIHFCGHMIAAPGVSGRFPADREPIIAAAVRDRLERTKIGFGYGSLACGADILFAEALLARNAELHVVLPFGRDEFEALSVARGGADWPARFRRCLAAAKSVTHATEDAYLGDDFLFSYASRLAMGLALLRAAHLDASIEQAAVWDGIASGGDAGTAVDVAFWRERGLPGTVIRCDGDDRREPVPPPSSADGLRRIPRAMLFGDMKGFSKLGDAQVAAFAEHVLGAFGAVLDGYGDAVLFRNTWGDGLFVVLSDVRAAAACALDLQQAARGVNYAALGLPADLELRLGGHVGPAFHLADRVAGRMNFFGAHVSRTARIEPVTPPGDVYVTDAFAALLALENDRDYGCDYVGHVPAAKNYGKLRMYLLRRKHAVSSH